MSRAEQVICGLYADRLSAQKTWRSFGGRRHIRIGYVLTRSRIKVNKKDKVRPPIELSRWYSTRARARKKSVAFEITPEFIKQIMDAPCVYCNNHSKASELDRKVPVVGYTTDNVVPACRRCNTVKSDTVTYGEMMFIAWYLG